MVQRTCTDDSDNTETLRLTQCTWSPKESESFWYLWNRLQVVLCMCMQVTWVQCVGTPQTLCFVDTMFFLSHSIHFRLVATFSLFTTTSTVVSFVRIFFLIPSSFIQLASAFSNGFRTSLITEISCSLLSPSMKVKDATACFFLASKMSKRMNYFFFLKLNLHKKDLMSLRNQFVQKTRRFNTNYVQHAIFA